MKKILILFFFLSSLNTQADIAYIDLNYILNKSNVGIQLNNHINNLNQQELLKFKAIEEELIKKEKSLIAQQNILDQDTFQKKLNSLSAEIKKYRSDKQNFQNDLKNIKVQNTKKILEFINPIITAYVNENSISIVIPKKNIIVGKKNLDITDSIIKLLNNEKNSLKF